MTTKATPRDEMDRLARAYFDRVCAADAEGLRALFAEDVRWRIPKGAIEPFGGVHEGAEKIVGMMLGAVGESFVAGSQRFEIQTALFGEDVACFETQMRARTPDGRDYCNDYTFFFEFREGVVREIREHVDTRYAAGFFG